MRENIKIDEYETFQVMKIVTGQEWKENCYLIVDLPTKSAIIIDPGYDCEEIITIIEKEKYTLKYILITHAHHDHIAGVQKLSEHFSMPCIVHLEDKRVLMHSPMYSVRFAKRKLERPQNVQWLNKELLSELEKYGIEILHTPGHSHGGICIFFHQVIFTGDTLVKNYLGRTDLPEGNKSEIVQSINHLLSKGRQMKSTSLYPGHGDNWTLREAQNWWNNQNIEYIQELIMF